MSEATKIVIGTIGLSVVLAFAIMGWMALA